MLMRFSLVQCESEPSMFAHTCVFEDQGLTGKRQPNR